MIAVNNAAAAATTIPTVDGSIYFSFVGLSSTVAERQDCIVEARDLCVSCIVINRHIVHKDRADAPATYIFPCASGLWAFFDVKSHAVTSICIFGRTNVESMDAALEGTNCRAQPHELLRWPPLRCVRPAGGSDGNPPFAGLGSSGRGKRVTLLPRIGDRSEQRQQNRIQPLEGPTDCHGKVW